MKWVLTPVKGCLGRRADGLTVRMRESRRKAKAFEFHVLVRGLPPEGVARFRVGLPTSKESENPSQASQLLGF